MIKTITCVYGDIVTAYTSAHGTFLPTGEIKVNGEFNITLMADGDTFQACAEVKQKLVGDMFEAKRVMWGGVDKGFYLCVTQYTNDNGTIIESEYEANAAVCWADVIEGFSTVIGGKTKLSERVRIPRRTLYNWINGSSEPSHYGKDWADILGEELLIKARQKFIRGDFMVYNSEVEDNAKS